MTEPPTRPAFKLFIGQIPKSFTEKDLHDLLQGYGLITEVHVLRDRDTQQSKGCGFVTFQTMEQGALAIKSLHDQERLDGMARPLQVKWADNTGLHDEKPLNDQVKVFFGSIPKGWGEDQLRGFVAQVIGDHHIVNAYVMRDLASGTSKGAGFLTLNWNEGVLSAVNDLHKSTTLEGCSRPLEVRVADCDQQKVSSKLFVGQIGEQSVEQITSMFSQFGHVKHVDIVVKDSHSQGCAFVHFTDRGAALDAIRELDGKVKIGGGKQPLVVRFAESPREKSYRLHHSPAYQAFRTHYRDMYPICTSSPSDPRYLSMLMSAQQQHYAFAWRPVVGTSQRGPEGANLFVVGFPADWTDMQLFSTFAPHGPMLSVKVFIDKNTGQSKRFGFVSYADRESAEAAVNYLNGSLVGPSARLKVQFKDAPPVQE